MFGIIANHWRLFRSVIQLPPKKVCLITGVTLTLHNFLRKGKSKMIYSPLVLTDSIGNDGEFHPGLWRKDATCNGLVQMQRLKIGFNARNKSKRVRDTFKDYFFNEGAVAWQWENI